MPKDFDNKFEYSNEIILNYRVIGSGNTPILFLHGFGTSSLSWDDIIPFFDKSKFTMYLVDLKGFGLSSKPDDDRYSIDNQADIILNFIYKMSLNDLILVGHSYGGGIALLMTIKEQENQDFPFISKMILIDSAAYNGNIPFFVSYIKIPILNTIILKGLSPHFTAEYTLKKVFHDKSKVSDDIVKRYVEFRNYKGADNALIQTAQSIIPDDYDEIINKYNSINIPVLLIWGKNDPVISLENGRRLDKNLPNSKLIVINNCGHVPHEECPIETYEAIVDFLN